MRSPPALRWGVLGAAWIAERAVLPAIAAAGGEVVALASRTPERARALGRQFPQARITPDYAGVLSDPQVEAVYLPLPNRLHEPWTLACADAGKHVLCEKPLADHPEAARRMVRACADAGVVLAEAVMFRYHPRMEQLEQLCRGGRLGELRHVEAAFTFPLDPGPNFRWEASLGGGALLDVGSYGVHAARWLLAAEPCRVAAVLQTTGGVDASCAVALGFPERRTAGVLASFVAHEHQRLTVVGTRAVLTVPRPFTAWTGERLPFELVQDGVSSAIPTPAADPYRAMVLAFTRSVRTGAPLLTPGSDGLRTLEVLQACRELPGTTAAAPV